MTEAVNKKRTELSAREIEVLQEVAKGKSDAEIADALYLSKRTVQFHVRNIFTVFEVKNRILAIRCGINRGLITFCLDCKAWECKQKEAGSCVAK